MFDVCDENLASSIFVGIDTILKITNIYAKCFAAWGGDAGIAD